MSIRSLFSRKGKKAVAVTAPKEHPKYKEDDILCEDDVLKKYIRDWCDNEGYKFEGFAIFLDGAGISLPVKISGSDDIRNSFHCIDASGKEYILSLRFGDYMDYCSELHVTEKSESTSITKRYEIGEKYYGEVAWPYMFLSGYISKKNDVELRSFYAKYSCDYTVTTSPNHRLEFMISRLYDYETSMEDGDYKLVNDTWVCKNDDKIQEYLLSYNYADFNVDELYAKLLEFLDVKNSDINTWQDIKHIWIKYEEVWKDHTKVMRESSRCLAMISSNNGAFDRYGYVTPTGESFWVSNEGDWSYSTENCEISYRSSTDKLKYYVEGRADEASKINMMLLIANVKKEISKMWSKVGL